jgi:hypothetical protein
VRRRAGRVVGGTRARRVLAAASGEPACTAHLTLPSTPLFIIPLGAGMNSLFYADGAFFERVYAFLKERGRADKAKMIRRALFIHQ